jgi:cell division protein FtsW
MKILIKKFFSEDVLLGKLLFFSVVAIVLFSILMIFSASSVLASEKFGDPFFFLKRHIIWVCLGFSFMFIGYIIDLKKIQYLSLFLLILCIILLVAVLIPGIGTTVGGARRWIRFLGFGFQPSEFAKLAFIIYLSSWLDRKHQVMNQYAVVFIPNLLLMSVTMLLIFKEPDLGTIVLMGMVVFSMYIVAGINKKYIFTLILAGIPVLVYGIMGTAYRLKRVLAFLNPWEHFSGTGYQVVQSYLAIANSGILGRGLGGSQLKLSYLPEAHTDFIFSIIIEELGILGTSVVIFFYIILTIIGIRISLKAPTYFTKMLAFGITTAIAYQALMNIAVITGSIPTKGIPLPFLSFGGSSLVVSMLEVGILLNIFKDFDKKNSA